MGHVVMFTELDRLQREELMEIAMATEGVVCSKCHRRISITAEEGQEMHVKCPCGHEMIVVIERAA